MFDDIQQFKKSMVYIKIKTYTVKPVIVKLEGVVVVVIIW